MPIHVDIRINRELIEKLHIGRLEGGTDADDVNIYVACLGPEPLRVDDWIERGVKYEHRYGDGALVCVRRALDALEIQVNLDLDFQENLREAEVTNYLDPATLTPESLYRLQSETWAQGAAAERVRILEALAKAGYRAALELIEGEQE
jgi:hypothetical protein